MVVSVRVQVDPGAAACRSDQSRRYRGQRTSTRRSPRGLQGCQDRRQSRVMSPDSCMLILTHQLIFSLLLRMPPSRAAQFSCALCCQRQQQQHRPGCTSCTPAVHTHPSRALSVHLSLPLPFSLSLCALWVKHMVTWGAGLVGVRSKNPAEMIEHLFGWWRINLTLVRQGEDTHQQLPITHQRVSSSWSDLHSSASNLIISFETLWILNQCENLMFIWLEIFRYFQWMFSYHIHMTHALSALCFNNCFSAAFAASLFLSLTHSLTHSDSLNHHRNFMIHCSAIFGFHCLHFKFKKIACFHLLGVYPLTIILQVCTILWCYLHPLLWLIHSKVFCKNL